MELNGEARSLPLPRHSPLSSDNFVSAYARRPLNPMTTRAIINKAVAAQGGNRVRNPFDPMILLRVHEVLKSPSLTGIPPHSKTRRHSENTDGNRIGVRSTIAIKTATRRRPLQVILANARSARDLRNMPSASLLQIRGLPHNRTLMKSDSPEALNDRRRKLFLSVRHGA